ncbi:MAG: response regulator [Halococcoides sp.]
MTDRPVVLIAEDEDAVAEGYELWLGEAYDLRRAADGQAAIEMVDDSVDVVLLDRMMPERSGKEVLETIRERDVNVQVAMVTAVEPDFDIVEMGFDAYVTKPPDREELIATIERLLDREEAGEQLQTYESLMARKGALEAQKTDAELEASDAYRDLLEKIERAEREVDDTLGDLSEEVDFVSAVREVTEEAGEGSGPAQSEPEEERDDLANDREGSR